jgi:hypothetical protein
MSRSKLHAVACSLVAAITLHAGARASTYVVDASGGGQFLDIPPAIAAAQDGDVLLVISGVYSGFTLDKGLAIIGYGTVVVQGPASVSQLSIGSRAALVNLAPTALVLHACAGPVIAQDFGAPIGFIDILGANDVRLRNVDVVTPQLTTTLDACSMDNARVEIVDARIFATQPLSPQSYAHPAGGMGIRCAPTSRLHLVHSSVHGGAGADVFIPSDGQAGIGGTGVSSFAGASLVIAGDASDIIQGGRNGQCLPCDCANDGAHAGAGILAVGSCAWSGVTICRQPYWFGHQCIELVSPPIVGTASHVVSNDPTLDVSGTPNAGATVTFTLHADPGANATLFFGRQTIVVPDPNIEIELLTPRARIVDLGTIPASGVATFDWPIDASLPPGSFFVAQAEVTGTSSVGPLRRTNSIPIVVR